MRPLKLLYTALAMLLFNLTALAQQTTHLQGRIYLNDTLPAAYASIYLPQYGIGTITNEEGNYVMDEIPASASVTIEYAYLGYKTEVAKVNLSEPNHRYAHDVHLKEQTIELSEVYLTPNGEDPCIYILRQVHDRAQANRKRLKHYKAVCDGSIHLQDLDIIMAILPDFAKTMIHALLRTVGLNALFNYLTGSEKVDVTYQYTQTWNNGKAKNSEMQILASNPTISDKAKKQMNKLQIEDFYNIFYSQKEKFDVKKMTDRNWKLKGVIEENGHSIDIMTRTEGDSVTHEHTMYIIEDLWQVLRYESRSSNGSVSRYECHDIGNGIYLPVLFATNPIPIDMNELYTDLKKDYEQEKAKGEATRSEKKVLERYEKILKERPNPQLNVITPYNIKYSEVSF